MLIIKTLITKVVKPIYSLCFNLLTMWFARARKRRSIRAMQCLDDHLLDDIGFRREGEALVPLCGARHDVAKNGELVRNHQRKVRLRCSFLVRRRQRLKR
ncbi:MAG: hypothetical protein ACI9NY_001404 [Kiritimatiellia bacterium]|jgi:uncharacterized protein YjiS (DUF1127 family)